MFQTWYVSCIILLFHAKPFSEASEGKERCSLHSKGDGYRLTERFASNCSVLGMFAGTPDAARSRGMPSGAALLFHSSALTGAPVFAVRKLISRETGNKSRGVKIGVVTFRALSWMPGPLQREQSAGRPPRKATPCWFVVAMAQTSNRLRVQRDLWDLSRSPLGWTEKP